MLNLKRCILLFYTSDVLRYLKICVRLFYTVLYVKICVLLFYTRDVFRYLLAACVVVIQMKIFDLTTYDPVPRTFYASELRMKSALAN